MSILLYIYRVVLLCKIHIKSAIYDEHVSLVHDSYDR